MKRKTNDRDEEQSKRIIEKLMTSKEDEHEIPQGRRDLYDALIIADGFEANKKGEDYLIQEGWDLRDTIHALVTLAQAYRAERMRNNSKGLDIQPIESIVEEVKPPQKPEIIISNQQRLKTASHPSRKILLL